MKIKIGELSIGDEVKISFPNRQEFEATIIATNKNSIIVGMKECVNGIGWPISENLYMFREFIYNENIFKFKYGWIFTNDFKVVRSEPKAIYPDQICSDCKLSAPHSSPNQGSEFICDSCKLMKEL